MGARFRFVPKTKTAKLVLGFFVLPFAAAIVFYLLVLGMHIRSSWQASRTLDRLEALRIGDPVSKFLEASRDCPNIHASADETTCRIASGAFRYAWSQALIKTLPERWDWPTREAAWHAGIRDWQLVVTCTSQGQKIHGIDVRFYVVGQYETLGAQWSLAPEIPESWQRHRGDKLSPEDQRTFLHWYHITSMPSGEGFSVDTTQDSTEREMMARRINRACMTSVRGCDGLCELLPDAVPLLNERRRSWGGSCGVPRSWCTDKINALHITRD
jgi:hypothetical protein